jgi:hypothetical protein
VTRKLLALMIVVLAAAPAVAQARNTSPDAKAGASKQCAMLAAKLGSTSFGLVYASTGACVSELVPVARFNASAAVKSCGAERSSASFAARHGGRTFARFYGTAHAYTTCLAAKERVATTTQVSAEVSAAIACRTEQADTGFAASHSGQTFAQVYGADSFPACVALKLHPVLTVTPVQPAAAAQAQQQQSKVGECSGPPEAGGAPARPLVASCTAANTN